MIQTLGLPSPPKRSEPEQRSTSAPILMPGNWKALAHGNGTEAGVSISDASAMQTSTVFACIRILSESVASLPLRLYRVTDKGRTLEYAHPLARLLTVAPNEEQSPFTLIETLMGHLALTGNGYVQIERDASDLPIALWNLHPRQTEPFRQPDGSLAYRTTDGEAVGVSRVIDAADMLHVPLTSWDGVLGMSPIMQCKRTIGLSIAAEQYATRFFANNAAPSGILSTTKQVRAEDKQKMRADWEEMQAGKNQHRVAVLDQELKFQPISVTNEEAQFLESRQFSRADIAAIFRIPNHMVGDTSKLTNANTENLNLSFVTDTLRPYLTRIESEITKKLLLPEPGKAAAFQARFDASERLRGDFLSQMQGIAIGRNAGILTGNDGRRVLNLNEAGPELDTFWAPVNMQDALKLLEPGQPKDKQAVQDAE